MNAAVSGDNPSEEEGLEPSVPEWNEDQNTNVVVGNSSEEHLPFRVDVSLIPQAQSKDSTVLDNLGLQVFNQEDLEAGVVAQAEKCLEEQALSRHKKAFTGGTDAVNQAVQPITDSSLGPGSSKSASRSPGNTLIERYLADQESRMKSRSADPKPSYSRSFTTSSLSKSRSNALQFSSAKRKFPSGKQSRKPKKQKKFIVSDDESDEVDSNVDEESVSEDEDADEDVAGRRSRKGTRDDSDSKFYFERLRVYEESKSAEHSEENFSDEDITLTEGLRIPRKIWTELYPYQKAGVRWLWELHRQEVGGILGDEMGLGKTIQIIAFLAGLHHSRLWDSGQRASGLGPCIIVCPATVLFQWLNEFHKWWPPLRVMILHASGSHTGTRSSLVLMAQKTNAILLTTYQGLLCYQDVLLKEKWHYVILDEGHKIRNPDSQITITCKQFRTPHRVILSGSPMQNSLKELWSLFDFAYPGKLGLMNVFLEQFSVPIIQGSREMASDIQVQTAFKCATVLKDTITPYLLRRSKADVKTCIQLPQKDEQVLFCQLTDHQRKLYQEYLDSDELKNVMHGSLQVFVGLMQLRKLCNHPDLIDGGPKTFLDTRTGKPIVTNEEEQKFGYWRRSGKMIVVEALLKIWKRQGHKVLLFSQSRKLLDVMEQFVQTSSYSYLRMDGNTAIQKRQSLIKSFNEDPETFLFLLTTKVGGLGVNLTGANRVIIFDPDWNPSTDTQARERAWRIGQTKNVTIYRLLCAGTIEEKIYHRQIFKQYLTNRVLKDPKQKRFFKHNDLHELFTLAPPEKTELTETGASFGGVLPDRDGSTKPDLKEARDPKEKLRLMAKAISKKIGNGDLDPTSSAGSKMMKSDKLGRREKSVDGEMVEFLAKREQYQSPVEAEMLPAHNDDFILRKLFKKTPVHSAIPFEDVANGGDQDHAVLEQEAEKVAHEAMRVIRESRKLCHDASSGIPNWTGQAFSVLGHDVEDDSPPSASQLLSQIRKISARPDDTSSGSSVGQENSQSQDYVNFGQNPNSKISTFASPENLALARRMVQFLNFETDTPGEATSEIMIAKFRSQLPTQESTLFRAVLRIICSFQKRNGVGMWTLREEYKEMS